jgi:hypothetical protein
MSEAALYMSAFVLVATIACAIAIYFIARRFGVTARQGIVLAGVGAIAGVTGLIHGPDALRPGPPATRPLPPAPAIVSISAEQLARLEDTGTAALAVIDNVVISPPNRGSWDAARRTATAGRGVVVSYVGWAADPRVRGTGLGVVALLDGKPVAQGKYGAARADVADDRHIDAYYWSGFRVDLPTSVMTPGPHTVRLVLVTTDATAYETIGAPSRLVVTAR